MRRFDVLIIGSGLAGQSLALRLAEHRRVALVTKRTLEDSSSSKAQGGIAAIFDPADAVDAHVADTLTAGAGLCDTEAARFVVENSTEAIDWLIAQGVPFTKDAASATGYHLTREGGHGHRRILHVDDATGAAIQKTLSARVRAHPNITVLERHIAVDLINAARHNLGRPRCLGAYVLDIEKDRVITIGASATILASGGAGKVYLYTTNPDTATGDGIAMAWRAGCRVANMEFIQFHPTCLFHPQARTYLITEAMRGEGGILRLPDGTRFMPQHDERAELAPRDVVARAIDFEMKKGGYDCVFLDITHRPKEFIVEHFPNIYATCMKLGIDITKQQIPVVPAVHFTCGGVVVDFKARTDLPGLYAVGETTYTGLHGANRLASNSLTECLVFSAAAAKDILASESAAVPNVPLWDDSRVADADERVVISHNWDELRRFMWDYVGIVRTNKRLDRAEHRIRLLDREIDEFYANFRISSDLVELRNLVLTAQLIIRSAQHRHESRGLHYSADYPDTLPKPLPTVLMPKRDGRQPSIFG